MLLNKLKPLAFLFTFLIFSGNSIAQNIDEYRASINSVGGIEKFLLKMEREISKTLPRAKDQYTEFISVSSYGRTISFYTKVKNSTRDQIVNNHSAISETKTQSINSLCSLPLSKLIINEYGAVYKYVVLAMDGAYAFEYFVDKPKCASI
jgi:hypothetical protein